MRNGWARLLLFLGGGIVTVGLLTLLMGLLLSDDSAVEQGPPPAGTAAQATSSSRALSPPITRAGPFSSGSDTPGSPTTISAQTSVPSPTTSSLVAGSSTTAASGDQPPPGVVAPAGDPSARLTQASRQAGYIVLRLRQEDWELAAVDLGLFNQNTYVDSVYRRRGDYLNLAQSPVLDQPPLPNATQIAVRGQSAQLLDMGGGITLIQWDEGGSRVRVTSDVGRDELLALLSELQLVQTAG